MKVGCMVGISEQAEDLNRRLKETAPQILSLLSSFGKNAYFPSGGILAQTAEARSTVLNATIGQAFEDDGSPMVLDALQRQINLPPKAFLYSSSFGQKDLRELWGRLILEKNPSIQTQISLSVVSNALTHGVFLTNRLFVENENVILPDKFWGNYRLLFPNSVLDRYPLFRENKFNIEGLCEKLSGNGEKKIVLLNFPNNPTGYTPTEGEAEEIVKAINECAERDNQVVVICDDAYFGLVFEEGIHNESIFAKIANLNENVLGVKIDGLSKEAYAWGLRVGFMTYGFKNMTREAAEILENKTAGAIRGSISNVCTISQLIALEALKSYEFEIQIKKNFSKLKERYDIVKETIKENPHYSECFKALPFNSGYFMCIELRKNNADVIRRRLIETFSSGVIAIDNMLRIAYSSVNKKRIPLLFKNIYSACRS